MDASKIYQLLDAMIAQVEEEQKEALTDNDTPEAIADKIHNLKRMKIDLYGIADDWRERGITHNISNLRI